MYSKTFRWDRTCYLQCICKAVPGNSEFRNGSMICSLLGLILDIGCRLEFYHVQIFCNSKAIKWSNWNNFWSDYDIGHQTAVLFTCRRQVSFNFFLLYRIFFIYFRSKLWCVITTKLSYISCCLKLLCFSVRRKCLSEQIHFLSVHTFCWTSVWVERRRARFVRLKHSFLFLFSWYRRPGSHV